MAATEVPVDHASGTRLPTGTTIRFAVLISAIAAAGLFAFTSIYYLIPATLQNYLSTLTGCIDADPRNNQRYDTTDPVQARVFQDTQETLARCQASAFLDAASWILLGLVLLFGLAAAVYWLHPRWIIRRHRLRPLSAGEYPELTAVLDRIRLSMGLADAPTWMAAPYARTRGGQAFGTPRRRYVKLDMGLISRLPDEESESVVRHELAHLLNRDVGKTYLTVAIWWSFIIVVATPFAALAIYQQLPWAAEAYTLPSSVVALEFDGPLGNRYLDGRDMVPTLVDYSYLAWLTPAIIGLIYLARNAVLRAREVEADVTVVQRTGSAHSLVATLTRLAQPGRTPPWSRLTAHPPPHWRIAVLEDPAVRLRPGLWELAGMGLAAGLLAVNLSDLTDQLLFLVLRRVDAFWDDFLVGLLIGPALAGLLTASVGRSARSADRPSLRTWLAAPLCVAGGFQMGSLLPWVTTVMSGGLGYARIGIQQIVVTSAALLVGTVAVTVWFVSTSRGILSRPGDHGRAMISATVTSVIVFTSWFAGWFAFQGLAVPGVWLPLFRYPLLNPVDTTGGWYSALSYWAGVELAPLDGLVSNPLILPGLALAWLVPILGSRAFREARSALLAGLAGGVLVVVIGFALPLVARAALPESILHDVQEGDFRAFSTTYWNVYIGVATLAQAVVGTVVTARATRLRPALAVLAVSLTSFIATLGVIGTYTVARCVNLFGTAQPQCRPDATFASPADLHMITVRGIIVAIPAVLLGMAIAAALRRRQPAPQGGTANAFVTVRVTVAALAVVFLLAGAVHTRDAYGFWNQWAIGEDATKVFVYPRSP